MKYLKRNDIDPVLWNACIESNEYYIPYARFEYLDAPVKRVASLETPIPFAAQLEQQYLPKDRFEIALKSLLVY